MTEAKDGDIALASLMKRYASEGQAWIDLGEMVWPNNHPVCTY
jgi:hypothetical protein